MAYKKPENVAGLIRNEDGLFLEKMAADVGAGQVIIEIGPFTGKSTCFMARGVRESYATKHIYSIDPWEFLDLPISGSGLEIAKTRAEAHELFQDNVKKCGFSDIVTEFHGFSYDAANKWTSPSDIGLIYVDGDHKYMGVKADVDSWSPKLAVGSVMVFDDYNRSNGVKMAVRELTSGGRFAYDKQAMDQTDRFAVVRRTV